MSLINSCLFYLTFMAAKIVSLQLINILLYMQGLEKT